MSNKQPAPLASCRRCTHIRRPGMSAGYCGGPRTDLAPAYGIHHPLRELPADRGECCAHFARHG